MAREENLYTVLIPTMSKDMDEQLKLVNKVADVVDRANRKKCVTLLRYNVDKPENPYVQVQFFARKRANGKLRQLIYVIFLLEKFIYLPGIMNSVYGKVVPIEPIRNSL